MDRFENIEVGDKRLSIKWSDKHGRWDVIYDNNLYYVHEVSKNTHKAQVADVFVRKLREETVNWQ